jgi:uncharacterized protein YjbI with pentapeptide repeats
MPDSPRYVASDKDDAPVAAFDRQLCDSAKRQKPMAIDPKDVGELQKALNDAAGKASVLWTTFIIFQLYLLIAIGTVTHRDLFLETSIKLPVLNVDLPLVGFFAVVPIILVIFHFYVFLQIFAMARKVKDHDALLQQQAPISSDRQYLRQRLDSFVILQFLAGPVEQRTGFIGLSLRFIGWVTLAGLPIVILLQGQVAFLPYHLAWVVWLQRIAVLINLMLIWYFWNRIHSDDEPLLAHIPNKAWPVVGGTATLCVFLFSWSLATFPGEWAHDDFPALHIIPTSLSPHWSIREDWTSLHELLFAGKVDEVTGRPTSWFSNTLVLTDQSFVDPDKLDKTEVSHSFRGRDLSRALLFRTDLRKADFTGAILNQAVLAFSRLQGARFNCSLGNETPAGCAQLQDANLIFAILENAEFIGARMQGASAYFANFRGADLANARLQNADLAYANLEGLDLGFDELEGANLKRAVLQGARLVGAQLQGADLSEAKLHGVDLSKANLRGANLSEAELQGANLSEADLEGASLSRARIWRVRAGRARHTIISSVPNTNLTDLDKVDTNEKPWLDVGKRTQSFMEWRSNIINTAPERQRDEVETRLAALDPEKEPRDAIAKNFWTRSTPISEEENKKLATFLADLACSSSGAPFVARGLLQNRRVSAAEPQIASVADRLLKGKSDLTACPGIRGFTREDWTKLDELTHGSRPAPNAN